jgi:ABC-type transporter Mla subunit MlaD
LIAAGFAISCFALLLFLWIAFGGPTPLAAKSYRITAYFPEATQLAVESDVRIGGVSVGRVKEVGLGPESKRVDGRDTTEAVIEIEPQYAPISTDSRAILRQKTLLGETYVELTSGSGTKEGDAAPVALGAQAAVTDSEMADAEPLEEGAELGVGQTEEATQIDEIFNALDDETRDSFRRWQASSAQAIEGRGQDFNDALGNLAPFITDASDVVEILDRQEAALRGVIRDTGTTFNALSERGDELAGAITGSKNTFEALASEEDALAETFEILPTFQRESRLTLERLDVFQRNATPLIRDLGPVAQKLSPTLADVRRLSPDLRDLFIKLDVLQKESLKGLPALRKFLDGIAPLIDELDHFLANLNPILNYLEYQKGTVADFLAGPAIGFSGALDGFGGSEPAPRHYLRQLSIISQETLAISPYRLPTNRGNGYLIDGALNGVEAAQNGIFPNFDCKNTDYSPAGQDPDEDELHRGESKEGINRGNPPDGSFAACFIEGAFPTQGGAFGDGDRSPELRADP